MRTHNGSETRALQRVRAPDTPNAQCPQPLSDDANQPRATPDQLDNRTLAAVARLSGGVSQDFNDVLQALRNALELTLRQSDDPVRVRHWATVALQVVDHGSQLTAQLAAFSGQSTLEVHALRVADFLRRLHPALERCVGQRISLRLRLNTDIGDAMVDAVQLTHSMLNLAVNARLAMPRGGALTVGCQRVYLEGDADLPDGCYLRISVADTGVGMSPEARARAFEPFFTTRAVGEGVGLGLSQVIGFAQQSGGTARISANEGPGITVSMWLPALPEFADTLGPSFVGPCARSGIGSGSATDTDAGTGTNTDAETETKTETETETGTQVIAAAKVTAS